MPKPVVITIEESMLFPDFSSLYKSKGFLEHKVNSVRKAASFVRKQPVDFIVAEFSYAYSTNYSGIYKSNLEVLLVSLIKYSPHTKVIVLANKKDIKFIDVLDAVDYPVHGLLQLPTTLARMDSLLSISAKRFPKS